MGYHGFGQRNDQLELTTRQGLVIDLKLLSELDTGAGISWYEELHF
jgi:hypothetical protein